MRMAKKTTSESPRRKVKRLPKLKGGELLEVTVVSRKKQPRDRKRPIPKKELEADDV